VISKRKWLPQQSDLYLHWCLKLMTSFGLSFRNFRAVFPRALLQKASWMRKNKEALWHVYPRALFFSNSIIPQKWPTIGVPCAVSKWEGRLFSPKRDTVETSSSQQNTDRRDQLLCSQVSRWGNWFRKGGSSVIQHLMGRYKSIYVFYRHSKLSWPEVISSIEKERE